MKTLKREMSLGDVAPFAITIVVVGITVVLGIDILTDFRTDFTADTAQYNATGQAIGALTELTDKLGLIALVVVVAIVIFLLVRYLMVRGR